MDWDREFAAFLTAELEGRPPPAPVVAIVLPEEDAPDEEVAEIGRAEGQFLMIEYRDARGAASQRRITVQAIREGASGIPVLCCYCHERRAYRQFRVDRIRTVFDTDGVVHDNVPRFLAETFGLLDTSDPMDGTAMIGAEPQAVEDVELWPILRDALKPYATLLAALAHSDGSMSEAEVWIASEHLAMFAQDMGFEDLGPDEMDKLKAYLARLSPNEDTIWASCQKVFEGGNALAEAFLAAALALVDVDAKRHPEEIRLLNGLSVKLTGKALVESALEEFARPAARPKPKATTVPEQPWMPLRNAVKPDATLLVALAQSDGRASETELAHVARHCLAVASAAGFIVSDDEASRIETYIRRLKPSPPTIREAIELLKASPEGIRAFLDMAVALTDAEDNRSIARITLMERIKRDLNGVLP